MPDTDFKGFMKFYKNYSKKPYYFFVNNATLPAGSPLHFRCNLLERIQKVIMKGDEKNIGIMIKQNS